VEEIYSRCKSRLFVICHTRNVDKIFPTETMKANATNFLQITDINGECFLNFSLHIFSFYWKSRVKFFKWNFVLVAKKVIFASFCPIMSSFGNSRKIWLSWALWHDNWHVLNNNLFQFLFNL
jgi:hypothetical protein